MKVFENIEAFYLTKGSIIAGFLSDEEFQEGLKSIVDSIVPLRKDKKGCIAQYERIRDEHPITTMIAKKAMPFGPDFKLGQREVDISILRVIYEDRYSFGYLFWYLLSKYAGDVEYRLKDPEAPYKKSLIEYAIDFDLEETVNEAKVLNDHDRYDYLRTMLQKSKSLVLVQHHIKDEYELALSHLVDYYEEEYKEANQAVFAGNQTHSEETERLTTTSKPYFAQYFFNVCNVPGLMNFLHEGIDGKIGANALIYIQAAIDAGLLFRPPYEVVVGEFGKLCSVSNYNNYVIDKTDSKTEGIVMFKRNKKALEELTKHLKEEFNKA